MLFFLSKTLLVVLFFTVGLTTASCAADSKETKGKALQPGLYAVFQTNKGAVTCRLFEKEAPKTVDNFVGLANGTKEWTGTNTA